MSLVQFCYIRSILQFQFLFTYISTSYGSQKKLNLIDSMFVDLVKGIILRICYSKIPDLKPKDMPNFDWKLCFCTDFVNI